MKQELPGWYEPLKKKYAKVAESEWVLLHHMAAVKQVRKGDAFLRYGKVARFSGFVISDCFKLSPTIASTL